MNKKENGFSLVIVVIFMSIAALFVGYLMGSWLIGFLVEDPGSQAAEESESINKTLKEESPDSAEEVVNNSNNNLTAPAAENNEEEEESSSQSENTDSKAAEDTQNNERAAEESSENTESSAQPAGDYGVQIGAFANYNNALSLKDTVEEMGYTVIITDSSPHQVQVVGYSSREEAESAAAELEKEGYKGFIVVRE